MAIPFVTIQLDRLYNIRFGMTAQLEFEEVSGISCVQIQDNPSITIYAKALWVMLRRHNEALTLKQVTDLVDDYAESETYIIEKVNEAITAAFSTGDEEEIKNT